jgi:2-haloacid dehalogenase
MLPPDPDPADASATIDAVIFDFGGVLIDWNPRHLYRTLFDDEEAMERFLADVVSPAWNLEQDRGRTFRAAIEELVREHPAEADRIEAFWSRWTEMLGDADPATVAILGELRAAGIRVFGLTNWSSETFPHARPRYPFIEWFEDVVVSGEVRLTKPDPAIFRLIAERNGLDPARTVFVDDTVVNVTAAAELGFRALAFRDAGSLRRDLIELGVPLAAIPELETETGG